MAVCPGCGYEYEEHVRVCPECKADLVAADDPQTREGALAIARRSANQGLVRVYRGADELSVRRVESALEAAGVDTAVRSLQISAYDDIFRDTEGIWGDLLVLEKDEAKAREIIDVLETGTIVAEELPEDDEPAEES